MKPKITIPHKWKVPTAISSRIAEVLGTQRCLEAEGHLVMILHKLPSPDDATRYVGMFWRNPDGKWESDDGHAGIAALERHVTQYSNQVMKLEEKGDEAASAEDYFRVRREVAPILRAARNMYATISRGYEIAPDDRGLLACRNLAYTVERTAELLKEDATYGLELFNAKQAESQSLAAHRLNFIAAIFFPMLAFASIFGMNLVHGFEDQGVWLFWVFVALGILAGLLMALLLFSTNSGSVVKKKKSKYG